MDGLTDVIKEGATVVIALGNVDGEIVG